MAVDIELYLNTVYNGFWKLDAIENFFEEYHQAALELAQIIDWDEVVLFAIFSYDGETEEFISADFMKIRMNYDRYIDLMSKISPYCKLYIVRNQ